MGRIKEFYHDVITEAPEKDEAPLTEPEQLALLLDDQQEDVDAALMLLDGTESFAEAAPGEQDYLLPQLSVEGFDEILRKFWEHVRRFARGVVDTLTNDNRASLTACRVLGFQAENLRIESRQALAKPRSTGQKLLIRSHITALSVFYRPPAKVGDITAHLKNLEKVLVDYYEYVDRVLTPGMIRLSGLIRRIDPLAESFIEDTQRIKSELEKLSPAVALGRQFEGRSTNLMGPHLMGNVRLAAQGLPSNPTLNEINQSRVYLRHSELTPRRMPEQIALPKFNLLASDQCLDQVIRMTKVIRASLESGTAAKRGRALKELTGTVDRFVSRAGELEDGRRQEKEEAQAIANAVRAAGQWLQNPYHGLTTNALRAMRGALLVCRRNTE